MEFKADDDSLSEESGKEEDTHSKELNEGGTAQEGLQHGEQQQMGARRSLDTVMDEANNNAAENREEGDESSGESGEKTERGSGLGQ